MTGAAATVVEEITALFPDTRVQYCRLEASETKEGAFTLRGAVLDQPALDRVQGELGKRLPGVQVDLSGVEVLRRASTSVAVGTNLTGLYREPSFFGEQMSQLLNGWPLEVLKEEDGWCFVRQTDGYLGWAYAPYLTEALGCTFTHLVCVREALVLLEPREDARISTRVLGGTAVAVDAREGDWRHVALAGSHSGWVHGRALRSFAALPETAEGRRSQIVEDAARFVGTSYLWGGCTAWGIDCSGFAQLMHRLSGVTLPRDADMQYAAGRPVEFPYQPGDLLFYGDREKPGRIDHVSISLGGWDIVHSSRRINGVYYDNVQAVPSLRESFAGARTFAG